MNLFDIKDEEEWQEILNNISESLGMPATFMSPDSVKVMEGGERNVICKPILSNAEAKAEICVKSAKALSKAAREKRRPVIISCEVNMCKCVIPVFAKEEFLGFIVLCGAAMSREEMPRAIIAERTHKTEEEVNRLIPQVPIVDMKKVVEVSNRVFKEVSVES